MSDTRSVAVLGYHKVGPPTEGAWETWYAVPTDIFARQMDWLAEHHYTAVSAQQFVAALDDPAALPDRAVLITFDDAYRSVLDHAVPHLVRHNFPAVVFLPTRHVGGSNVWDANTREPVEPICTWDELRQLRAAGFSVQSHAASHRTFKELSPAQIEQEALEAKAALERELGDRVDLLAYPFSDAGEKPKRTSDILRRAGYRAAFLFTGGVARLPADDVFQLPRVPVWPDTRFAHDLGGG